MSHSNTMEVTKRVNETIRDNFTSSQIANTLDDLLFRALYPIITQTVYVDRVLASLLSWLSLPRRRYISHLPKVLLIRYIIIFLSSTDPDERMGLYKKMKFERGLHFSILNHFLEVSGKYKECVVADLKGPLRKKLVSNTNHMMLTQLGVTAEGDLWIIHQNASAWFKYAVDFRNLIIEKYMRHAVNHAVIIYRRFNYMDKDDLIQNLLLSVNRAINKYDCSKGTLTTYINNWFKDTRKVSIDYNKCVNSPNHVSFDALLEQNSDVELNEYLNLTTEEIEEDKPEVLFVRRIAKYADPHGFARLELSIGEILDETELQTLSLSLCR